VKAKSYDVAVEYRDSATPLAAEALSVPFQLLADCGAKSDEPVQLEAVGDGCTTATWRDGSVPQVVRYETTRPVGSDAFPALPETFADNPPAILQAITDAAAVTDPNSARYALSCLLLRGATGSIIATDGRQMLLHSGFEFPWDDDVLIPASKAQGSLDVSPEQPVAIGKTEDWVAVRAGPWTFFFSVNKDGRFPAVDSHVSKLEAAAARLQIEQDDAEFLGKSIAKLPCDDDYNHPVTVDLNGTVAVRAKGDAQALPTELILARSTFTGEPIRINTNRKYLARALKLGFQEVLLYEPKSPVFCRDTHRTYMWAPLDPEAAIPPAEDAVRILSVDAVEPDSRPLPQTRNRIRSMSQQPTNANGQAKANGRAKSNGQAPKSGAKADHQGIAALIEQAEKLRAAQRESLVQTNELLKALKRHRRQSRIVRNTLASLQQLKTIGV
jgi:hypothetical protein